MMMTSAEILVPASADDDLSNHLHRQVIGYLGVTLPLLVWLVAGWRPIDEIPRWTLLGSISAYYHTGAIVIFTGTLVALALFLLTYRGYNNSDRRRDRSAAMVAGTAALFVAFFPTDPGALPGPDWWAPMMGHVHLAAAVILFLSFAYFSWFLFPKSNDQARNPIHKLCALGILVSLAWAFIAYFAGASIFWPETYALLFFGGSWLVKGRAEWTARQFASRIVSVARPACGN